jgi:protein-tyrosine-phosphatase
MAAALFRSKMAEAESGEWQIESAGTWALEGERAPGGVELVMRKWGLDLSAHRSRCVSRDLLAPFHLVLTMEQGQKEALKTEFREMSERIYLLSEMAGLQREIYDPAGGRLEDFEATAVELDHLISLGFENICRLAQEYSDR